MKRPNPTSPRVDPEAAEDVAAQLKNAGEVAVYFREPLPIAIFDALRETTRERQKSLIEAVAEDVADVGHLRALHSLGLSLYYGLGLPSQTLIIVDRKRAFSVSDPERNNRDALRVVKNAEDLYLSLLWHRFGLAVLVSGVITEIKFEKHLFSLKTDQKREEWFRLKTIAGFPGHGARVDVFGWQKWNSRIIEVLEIKRSA